MHVRVGDPYGYAQEPLRAEAFEACLDAGRHAIDWERKRALPPGTGSRRRGVGMAAVTWKSGVVGKGLDHSGADVRWAPDGSVHLLTGAADLGTGIRTTLAQICAEVMGVGVADVRLSATDTAVTAYDSGAFASRSLFRNGQAVEIAARAARADLLDFAADILEADAGDLEIRDGAVRAVDAPERSIALRQVIRRGLLAGREFRGSGTAPLTTAPTFAAQYAEVEVDVETGRVEVLRVVAVQDVGRAINPTIVEGQIQGAVHQGIGYALTEGLVIDPDTGTLLNGTFMDYRLLTSADSPTIEAILVEDPDPAGPFGAKGVGEASIVITAPAIANAILHATGASIRQLPMTPERVLAAIEARSG
jgi:xanthine dehydrogenase molybdenum-binding subunit